MRGGGVASAILASVVFVASCDGVRSGADAASDAPSAPSPVADQSGSGDVTQASVESEDAPAAMPPLECPEAMTDEGRALLDAVQLESLGFNIDADQRTAKNDNGIFTFGVPVEGGDVSGDLRFDVVILGVPQTLELTISDSYLLNDDYVYVVVESDRGERIQHQNRFLQPLVNDLEEYRAAPVARVSEDIADGAVTDVREAVWTAWILQRGDQIADFSCNLLKGGEELEEAASVISNLPIYHPFINLVVQTKLAHLGYDVSSFDGSLNPEMIAAVNQFQQDQALEVTGRLSHDTLLQLFGSDLPPE